MARYSRKDYEATAEALNDIRRRGIGQRYSSQFSDGVRWALEELSAELCYMYEQDNPKFDRDRFFAAINKD